MLVLTRGIGEEIVIADNIRVTVLGVQSHRVRLGIAAPPDVPVCRRELLDRRSSMGMGRHCPEAIASARKEAAHQLTRGASS